MDWLIWVVLSTLLCGIQAVSLNPFAAFADHQYEPSAEYSMQRGVYLTNMPTASIFPLMNDENINSMVGIPALQTPFVNPLLSQQSSLFTVPKQNVRSKAKNLRLNQLTSTDIRDQGNNQQNLRGMTLDLRGGGYRLEQPRSQRPYKPPGPGASPPRNNGQRPNGARNTASSVNRQQVQRPRNTQQKPPQYNRFASIPSNVEFVNPENVLPLHPRIYKQFLQQNPQAAAYLRAQKQSPANFASAPPSKSFDTTKQIPPKITRNRGERPNNMRHGNIRPNSQLSSLSSFANAPTNFQLPETQQLGGQLNLGLQGQSSLNQGRQHTFEDFYNSDPQFYAQLSQTPEGKAMINEMMKHFPSSRNKPTPNVANKVPTSIVPKTNPFANTYADINSYHAAAGLATGNSVPTRQNQYGNNFGLSGPTNALLNKHNVPDYSLSTQFSQRPQQPIPPQQIRHPIQQKIPQQQPVIQHQAALQPQSHLQNQPHQLQQQPQISSIPSSPQLPNYSGRQPYDETIPSPEPLPEPKKPYVPQQNVNQQYNSYSDAGYSDDSSSSFANSGTGYDPSSYQSPYQENPKVVDGSTVDHTGYASNFSPVDPLSSVENADVPTQNYYNYPSRESPTYSGSSSHQRYPSTALHEISPSEIVKRPAESSNSYNPVESSSSFRPAESGSSFRPAESGSSFRPAESGSSFRPAESGNSFRPSESSSSYRPQTVQPVNAPGYWTPEQLFAPQSTGLQNESPFAYASAISSSSQHNTQDEQQDGSERAALHLPEEVPSWSVDRPQDNPSVSEYSEASELDAEEGKDNLASTEQPENSFVGDSDENFKATIRDLQKLWTRVPPRSTPVATRATTVIYRSTEAPPLLKYTRDELKNHRTTPSYTFQYSPTDKSNSKSTAAWWSRKPDGTRYKIPPPQPNTTTTTTTTTTPPTTTSTTTTTATTTTTTMKTTSTTESEEPTFHLFTTTPETTPATTSVGTTTPSSNYQDTDNTPLCAKHNNLTYCLQDPEYPKDAIREAIERNRHPLDHFLVDISAASNIVDDQSLHSVFENSAPLQSTSISYSFEGKVISPNAGEMLNTTGCNANVYYAKPLRALNTAGLWKVIVNVEFEDTGANYTQTVRIEECTHPPGYVATCGVHSISACLQQYKLYRLLSWEAHRGFYIDAFLLPVSCFCGSQEK